MPHRGPRRVYKPVRQLAREDAGLREVVLLEVGPRDLHAQEAIAVLARAEIADQRQQRAHLAAVIGKVDAVDEPTAVLGAQPPARLQVVLPIATTRDERGEAAAAQYLRRRVGLEEGANRHVSR